jgi:hypothetical protein
MDDSGSVETTTTRLLCCAAGAKPIPLARCSIRQTEAGLPFSLVGDAGKVNGTLMSHLVVVSL